MRKMGILALCSLQHKAIKLVSICNPSRNIVNEKFSVEPQQTPPSSLYIYSLLAQQRRFVSAEPVRQQQTLEPSGSNSLIWFAEHQDLLSAGTPWTQVYTVAGLII